MKSHLQYCPTCGSQRISLTKKDLEFSYRGRTIIVPKVECEVCSECGEVLTDYAANLYIDSVVFGHEQRKAS